MTADSLDTSIIRRCASGICDVDIGCGGADPLPCQAIGDVCSRPGDPYGVMLCVASPAGYGRCR